MPPDEIDQRFFRSLPATTRPRIALILPVSYRGGTQRLFKTLIQYFHSKSDVELIVCVPDGYLARERDFHSWVSSSFPELKCCEFNWRILGRSELELVCQASGIHVEQMVSHRYALPWDHNQYIAKSDFWFFLSDRIVDVLVPLKPYGIFVTDHLHRYFAPCFSVDQYADSNSAIWNFNRNIRNANLCVASTRGTVEDVKSYSATNGSILQVPLGVEIEHFHQLKTLVSSFREPILKDPYFIWVTNSSPHKNHLNAINALRRHFENSKVNEKVVITGFGTQWFNPDAKISAENDSWVNFQSPYVSQVREAFRELGRRHLERILFVGEVDDVSYVRYLKDANFTWHNVLADNGTYSVLEAAVFGVPGVSSDYPQMREIDELFGIGLCFFDPFSIDDTVRALGQGSEISKLHSDAVVSRIATSNWENWGDELKERIVTSLAPPTFVKCL